MESNEFSILRIRASSTDKIGHKLLYEHIVQTAKENGISGVTVYRGIMGYGESSRRIESSRYWELTEKLPVMIEMIDKTDRLESFFKLIEAELNAMSKGCLVTMERVNILLHRTVKNKY